MNGPPRDDSTDERGDPAPSREGGASERDAARESDPATVSPKTTADRDATVRPAGSTASRRSRDAPTRDSSPRDTTDVDDPLGGLLPRASVDSRWWYWIAAVPLYVVLGGLLAVLFVGAFLFDVFLTGGIATVFGAFIVVPLLGLVGLVLTIMFPIATYVDARAVAESDASWTPDPLVWGLAALATVVLSAFTLSVLQALYYLYKRHVAVGTP